MKTTVTLLIVAMGAASAFAAEAASPKENPPAVEESEPSIAEQLATAKAKLAKFYERYKDGHPTVQAQLARIADLEKSLASE